jgi:hypothetical protein
MDAEGQLELRGTPPLGFEARKRNLHLAPLAELKEFRGNTNLDLGYRCVRANAKTAHVPFTCRAHRRCDLWWKPEFRSGRYRRYAHPGEYASNTSKNHIACTSVILFGTQQAKRIENGAELRSRPNSGGKH